MCYFKPTLPNKMKTKLHVSEQNLEILPMRSFFIVSMIICTTIAFLKTTLHRVFFFFVCLFPQYSHGHTRRLTIKVMESLVAVIVPSLIKRAEESMVFPLPKSSELPKCTCTGASSDWPMIGAAPPSK